MVSSNVLIVNTKEYARVLGTKVVALCLRVLCIKFRANPRWVEVIQSKYSETYEDKEKPCENCHKKRDIFLKC